MREAGGFEGLVVAAREAGVGSGDYAVLEVGEAFGIETLMAPLGVGCWLVGDALARAFPNVAVVLARGRCGPRFVRCTESRVLVLRGEACEYCGRRYDGETRRCGGCAGSEDPKHVDRKSLTRKWFATYKKYSSVPRGKEL